MKSEHQNKVIKTFRIIVFIVCVIVIFFGMKYLDILENSYNYSQVERYSAEITKIKRIKHDNTQDHYQLTLKIKDTADDLDGKQCRVTTSNQTYKVGDNIDVYTNSKHRTFQLTEFGVQADDNNEGIIVIGVPLFIFICILLIVNAPYLIRTKDNESD